MTENAQGSTSTDHIYNFLDVYDWLQEIRLNSHDAESFVVKANHYIQYGNENDERVLKWCIEHRKQNTSWWMSAEAGYSTSKDFYSYYITREDSGCDVADNLLPNREEHS